MNDTEAEPQGALTIRTLAMPADTNPAGDIFGGWVMSQMDIAGAIAAVERAHGRVVTVAVEAMSFIAPVKVGEGAYIATGSVITEDVPSDALGVARSRQTNKEGWAERRRRDYPGKSQ